MYCIYCTYKLLEVNLRIFIPTILIKNLLIICNHKTPGLNNYKSPRSDTPETKHVQSKLNKSCKTDLLCFDISNLSQRRRLFSVHHVNIFSTKTSASCPSPSSQGNRTLMSLAVPLLYRDSTAYTILRNLAPREGAINSAFLRLLPSALCFSLNLACEHKPSSLIDQKFNSKVYK